MSFVYDIAEIADLSNFCYDVKILYQLKGYKFRTFLDLCHLFYAPQELESYHKLSQKIKAHLRSYLECGIDVNNYAINEIIPSAVLRNFAEEKQSIINKLFYRFSDEQAIHFYENFFPKLQCLHKLSKNLDLKFNFCGTKTGRLSFKSNTFNPYILPKEKRHCIEARPGFKIYEYDLKSSQPRIAIFSTHDDRFKSRFIDTDDIYSLFPGDREVNKVSFLRWMYSSGYAADDRFGNLAKPIKALRSELYDDALHSHGVIYNRFGRPLYFAANETSDNIVFQHFITSTEADALYEILCKMQTNLEGKESRILFPFYDAVICEIKDDEVSVPAQLKHTIENNYMDHIFFCRFPVEVKCGNSFGTLQAA